MMAFEMKPNTGSLFKNDRREKDSQPHAKGSALIDGIEYWISAWTNESKSGEKYQSLKFERKTGADGRGERKRGYDQPEQDAPANRYADLDDEVPF